MSFHFDLIILSVFHAYVKSLQSNVTESINTDEVIIVSRVI